MGTARYAKRVVFLLTLLWAVGSVVPAGAFDASRTVHLPDGTAISLGRHAGFVERAMDRGELAMLADGYLDRNQDADAAAVLVYAVRYRPGRTPEIAESAAGLAQKYQDPAWTGLVFGALAAEPAMLPEILAEALDQAALPAAVAEAAYVSAGLAPPARPDKPVREGDVAAETGSPAPEDGTAEGAADGAGPEGAASGGRSAGEVFGGSVLPEALRIGGGGTGSSDGGNPNSTGPGDDGGAS